MKTHRSLLALIATTVLAAALLWWGWGAGAGGGRFGGEASPLREASRAEPPTPSDERPLPGAERAPESGGERRVEADSATRPSLDLRFVDAGGAPIAGVAFDLFVEGDREAGRRGPRWSARADGQGGATLEVVAGRALTVWVASTPEHGWGEAELGPLAAGEHVARTVELATGSDLDWYVSVEARGRPVAGARVIALEMVAQGGERVAAEETATDATGLARFRCRSWWQRDARIEAPGQGVALVQVTEGHERPADALVVSLWPTATLRALVVDGAEQPVQGVRVAAEVWGFQLGAPHEDAMSNAKHRVEVLTDADGVALLAEVPAGLSLDLALSRDGRELARDRRAAPLAAGETEERRFVVGDEGAVRVRAVDPAGAPVEGVELWAVPGQPGGDHARVLERRRHAELVVARALTGPDGRAELAPLLLGRWTVGAVPPENEAGAERAADLARGSAAPLVELTAEAPVAELTLHLAPALALAGRLVDEAGAGVGGVGLSAYGLDVSNAARGSSAEDGTFRLEPLAAGRFVLSFELDGEPWIVPLVEQVPAGTEDLLIVLRRGAVLRGEVRDAVTGELAPDVMVRAYALSSDRPHVIRSRLHSTDGRFELPGLDDGRHALVAETMDGRIGLLTNLRVTRPEVTDSIELRVAPGVQVRLRYAGDRPRCDVLATLDGAKISYVAYAPGHIESFLSPPGRLELTVEREGEPSEHLTRDVFPGEPLEIVID